MQGVDETLVFTVSLSLRFRLSGIPKGQQWQLPKRSTCPASVWSKC